MFRLIGAILGACLVALGLGQAAPGALAAQTAPPQVVQHFAYKGAGCDGLKAMPSYEAVLGRKADGAVDFVNYLADWPGAVSASKWGSWCWAGKGYRLAWSVPLAVSKGANADLASVAAGKANTYFAQIAADLVAQGHADAYIRLGWEFNGGWYPWGGHNPANVAAAYRQAHDAMLVPGQHFRFVWNPALYMQGFWPDQAYPGDAYVDVIATDAYGVAFGSTDPATITAHSVTDGTQWNVSHVVAFAKAHGKPYAFPEWGTGHSSADTRNPGSGDYPAFIRAMIPYVQGAELAGYFDFDEAGGMDSSFAHNPQAAAAFKAAFAPAPAVPVAIPTPVATITASIDHGGSVVVTPNADGSAYLNLTFPKAAAGVTYAVRISAWRQLGWSPTNIWYSNQAFTYGSAGGTAKVYVGAK